MAIPESLSYDDAVRLLHRAVEERGENYNYRKEMLGGHEDRGCLYVHSRSGELVPGCIVGQILAYAGVPLSRMRGVQCSATEILDKLKITVGDDTAALLDSAQGLQDFDSTWGEAVYQAIREIEDNS